MQLSFRCYHLRQNGASRLRRRRDRFGPRICNDAMRSETLQFGTFVILCVYATYTPTATSRRRNSNGAMCSETLQFGICNAVRVRSETLQFFASKILNAVHQL